MDKAEIRAKAEWLAKEVGDEVMLQDGTALTEIEAALTAAYNAGDKAEYDRGWNDAVEESIMALVDKGFLVCKREIRRLHKKGKP